jgi:hypothetical protein
MPMMNIRIVRMHVSKCGVLVRVHMCFLVIPREIVRMLMVRIMTVRMGMCRGSRLKTVMLAFDGFSSSNYLQITAELCSRYLQTCLQSTASARIRRPHAHPNCK